jgi:hypothetical protein
MIAWTWESVAPDAGGCGVNGDAAAAIDAATKWMREHEATAARAEPVVLDVMESAYVPAGRAIVVIAGDGDRITFKPVPQ